MLSFVTPTDSTPHHDDGESLSVIRVERVDLWLLGECLEEVVAVVDELGMAIFDEDESWPLACRNMSLSVTSASACIWDVHLLLSTGGNPWLTRTVIYFSSTVTQSTPSNIFGGFMSNIWNDIRTSTKRCLCLIPKPHAFITWPWVMAIFHALSLIFLELVLKQEQEEYNREGIEWTNIEYFNNQVNLEIIQFK